MTNFKATAYVTTPEARNAFVAVCVIMTLWWGRSFKVEELNAETKTLARAFN